MMKNLALLFALTIAMFATSLSAVADTITLKDGTVHDGEIIKETDDYLWLKISVGTISTEKLIEKRNIKTIDRTPTDSGAMDTKRGKGARKSMESDRVIPDGVEKIAFISMEEMVGPYMNAEALSDCIDILKKMPENEKPDTVVLVFNSGGGALSELGPLQETIVDEIRPHFRTVAWIESAISAAAMTAWVVPEIYFQSKGNFGACTGFRQMSGGNEQMDGRELKQVLFAMEQVSLESGYDPFIMRAMQISGPDYPTTLSADIDEHGNVTWYLSEDKDAEPEGEYLVSAADEILTFDARQAEFFRFSKGTADTKDQLARLMGCEEWIEVGHHADKFMVEFRERVAYAENRTRELQLELNLALDNVSTDCAKWIGRAKSLVGEIKATVRGTSLTFYSQYSDEWFEAMNDFLRDLQRDCAEARRGGR